METGLNEEGRVTSQLFCSDSGLCPVPISELLGIIRAGFFHRISVCWINNIRALKGYAHLKLLWCLEVDCQLFSNNYWICWCVVLCSDYAKFLSVSAQASVETFHSAELSPWIGLETWKTGELCVCSGVVMWLCDLTWSDRHRQFVMSFTRNWTLRNPHKIRTEVSRILL